MEDIANKVHVAPPFDNSEVIQNMPIEVAIVVPSTNEADDYIGDGNFQNRIEYVEHKFDDWFGGDTTTRAVGGYREGEGDNAEYITEDVAVVMAGTTETDYKEHKDDLKELIRKRQRNWKQDTMAFRINNRTFIYPDRDYISDEDQAKMDILIP